MGPERELLVVLNDPGAADAMRELSAAGVASQILPPRLVLVRPDDGAADRLRAIPGVRAVYGTGDALDPQVLGLNEEEAYFVGAWQVRAEAKTRRGDGLAWDAPGFAPPDPPG